MATRYKLPPSVPAHRTLVADTSSSYWATREGLESTETVPGTAAMVSDGFSLKFRNLKNIAHVTNQIRALLRMRIQNRREIGSFVHAHTEQAGNESFVRMRTQSRRKPNKMAAGSTTRLSHVLRVGSEVSCTTCQGLEIRGDVVASDEFFKTLVLRIHSLLK